MKDYLKPSLRQNLSHFILHVRTNDLKSEKLFEAIAKEIMNIAVFLKSEVHNISVSGIIVRTDNEQLNLWQSKSTIILLIFVKGLSFALIVNSKRAKVQHLNNSRLHLNKKGSKVLSDV